MEDNSQSPASKTRRFFSGILLSHIPGLRKEVFMATVFEALIVAVWRSVPFAYLLPRVFEKSDLQAAFVLYFEGLKKQMLKSKDFILKQELFTGVKCSQNK